MASKTNIDFDVCRYWQSQLNEMSSIHDIHDNTVVGLVVSIPCYIPNIKEQEAILHQLGSKGKVVEYLRGHVIYLECRWSDLFTVTGIDKLFRRHPELVINIETLLPPIIFTAQPSIGSFYLPVFIAEGWAGDKLMYYHTKQLDYHKKQLDNHTKQLDYHKKQLDNHTKQLDNHTKQLDNHTKQLLVVTGLAARNIYAARRIHRFWRDVCWNPNYAYARKRLSKLHANDE